MNRVNRNGGTSVLDWPGGVPLRLAQAVITRPKFRNHAKIPHLRIVSEVGKDELFQYATAAKSGTAFWETVVYAGVALSAAGALVVAFGI